MPPTHPPNSNQSAICNIPSTYQAPMAEKKVVPDDDPVQIENQMSDSVVGGTSEEEL